MSATEHHGDPAAIVPVHTRRAVSDSWSWSSDGYDFTAVWRHPDSFAREGFPVVAPAALLVAARRIPSTPSTPRGPFDITLTDIALPTVVASLADVAAVLSGYIAAGVYRQELAAHEQREREDIPYWVDDVLFGTVRHLHQLQRELAEVASAAAGRDLRVGSCSCGAMAPTPPWDHYAIDEAYDRHVWGVQRELRGLN